MLSNLGLLLRFAICWKLHRIELLIWRCGSLLHPYELEGKWQVTWADWTFFLSIGHLWPLSFLLLGWFGQSGNSIASESLRWQAWLMERNFWKIGEGWYYRLCFINRRLELLCTDILLKLWNFFPLLHIGLLLSHQCFKCLVQALYLVTTRLGCHEKLLYSLLSVPRLMHLPDVCPVFINLSNLSLHID